MDWQSMHLAPKDKAILVKYDHDADEYTDPHDPQKLTDYAAIAEGGDFLSGNGFAVVIWADGYYEDSWNEDPYGPYWVPGGWFLYINGEPSDFVCNPVVWCELTE